MTRRSLLTPLILMVLGALAAVLTSVAVGRTPTLGLDLQGGFSVVLQAKAVNGKVPSEEAVEKAKDIIRQRVDGLGVAEPDITRQGRTVIVQLPGVTNRKKAEGLVGCTAKLEFRPVLSVAGNPDAPVPTTGKGDGTTTTAAATSTTAEGDATTTTAGDGATTTTAGDTADTTTTAPAGDGDGETGMEVYGFGTGEGAQFAPTTTTTLPPTTTTDPAATTTTAAGETTTTTPGDTTTTTVPAAAGSTSCGDGAATATTTTTEAGATTTTDPAATTTTIADPAKSTVTLPSDDGLSLYTLGPVGFTGDALSSAQAALGSTGQWIVNVSVKGSSRSEANAAFNACNAGSAECPSSGSNPGAIAIVLDNKVLSAPAVQSQNLADDTFQISGDFTEGEAKDLGLVLRYGSLPVEFEQVALQQVSATLGRDSLNAGLVAGLIGIAILAIYMFLYYRGFGLVVVVSLAVWGALMYGLVCFLSATQGLALTLAGITGIIVSVGTTVDTYVVVFERVKDEIRNGRSVRVATERGYRSGINTVLTANGAAFIGAFLLWILTVGPVRGFAYFLGLSVILDLGVAILFTRPLVLLLGRSPRFARARFLGLGASTDQATLPKAAKA